MIYARPILFHLCGWWRSRIVELVVHSVSQPLRLLTSQRTNSFVPSADLIMRLAGQETGYSPDLAPRRRKGGVHPQRHFVQFPLFIPLCCIENGFWSVDGTLWLLWLCCCLINGAGGNPRQRPKPNLHTAQPGYIDFDEASQQQSKPRM